MHAVSHVRRSPDRILTRCVVQTMELADHNNDVYEIKKIVEERKTAGAYEYKVVWVGFPGQDTWEPLKHIRGRGDTALKEFKESRDPQKQQEKAKSGKKKRKLS